MWLKATDIPSKTEVMFDSDQVSNMNYDKGTVQLRNGFVFEPGTEAVVVLWEQLRGNPGPTAPTAFPSTPAVATVEKATGGNVWKVS